MEVTIYILRCSDGSYYTGLTKQEIEARVWEHNAGTYDGYTPKRLPVELVFTETYDRIIDAIARERQIKGWSRQQRQRTRMRLERGCRLGFAARARQQWHSLAVSRDTSAAIGNHSSSIMAQIQGVRAFPLPARDNAARHFLRKIGNG